jgi:hypothetical protein
MAAYFDYPSRTKLLQKKFLEPVRESSAIEEAILKRSRCF